jgi:DNA-binding NarL/FixJ family response regulator
MEGLMAPVMDSIDNRTRILLVNRNPELLDVTAHFLGRCPELFLVGALNGDPELVAQALDLQPDVVLIDLDRPHQEGLQSIPRLRAGMPNVGIVALTVAEEDTYRQAASAAGADDLVTKSRLVADLLPAIRRVVAAGRGQARQDLTSAGDWGNNPVTRWIAQSLPRSGAKPLEESQGFV